MLQASRRQWLAGSSLLAVAGMAGAVPAFAADGQARVAVQPVPLRSVRLKPSIFADAVAANRAYLASLDPERLLHNFYLSAGLPAPKPVYGGWEALGIAGHSLGHWLTGVSILVANTGDAGLASKLDHCLAEMARIQAAHGDGYCGGTTVERGGEIVDGKIVFEEVRRGEISSHGFDLNGGWVPLYTWHKVHAGLIDAHVLGRNPRAMPVLLGLAGYLAGVLEPLSDEQMQRVLAAEHGGLNEAYADTYTLTGDPRWLRMAEKIYHRAVLDPLVAQEDKLEGLHANTQIPKVIGLARIHEITGEEAKARAARFFHERVVNHHTYVIGGNSEREHFGAPDHRAHRITEATCEACNTYNMLKLTRHLYSWQPDAKWFDFYEQAQLNHIMAHQRPKDGRFVYFMPLAAGARRVYSEPEDSFWCCVGSGMESHAKHADSIFWSDPSTLFVNLYIPAQLDMADRGLAVDLETRMPHEGHATLTVEKAPRTPQAIALRIPGWTKGARLLLNGREANAQMRGGYAVVSRMWKAGDKLELTMPMDLAVERTPDDPSVVAFRRGPLVLAADLGPASEPFMGLGPALVSDTGITTADLQPVGKTGEFRTTGGMGEDLTFRPFFGQYDRRTAVYFPSFTAADWASKRGEYVKAEQDARALARRTVDTLYLGEMQPERDHQFVAGGSEVVNWNGRPARRVPPGETIEFTLRRRPGASVLRMMVWNGDAGKPFAIAVDGNKLEGEWPKVSGDGFVGLDFPLPNAGEQGRDEAVITLTALKDQALVYEALMMTGENGEAPLT